MLCTQKGVHHLDIALCGCRDKDKMPAAPTPSARQKMAGAPHRALLVPEPGTEKQWTTPKSWIVHVKPHASSDARLDSTQLQLALVLLLLTAPGPLGSLHLGSDSAEVYTFGSTVTLQRICVTELL